MNIFLKSMGTLTQTIIKSASVFMVIFMISAGPAFGGGVSGLLGVIPGFPQIDATGVVGQGCTYDSGTMTLTITSTPSLYFPDANTLNFVSSGALTITAVLDLAGNVQSGTLVVNGTTSGGLGDPLLTGNISAIGLEDTSVTPGATDRGDYRIVPTGGSILTDLNWPMSADIGATLTMEGSTYAGSLASNWACARAKLIVGPINVDVIKDPFDCYAVNKVKTKDKAGGTDKDKVKIHKAGLRLDLPNMVDLNADMTQVRVDDLTVDIPAGSFEDKGNGKWEFKTASGVIPKIKMKIDFKKATWEFDCTGCDASLVNGMDGIDVCLMINGFESCENVVQPVGGGMGGPSGPSGHSSGKGSGNNRSCRLATGGGPNTSDSGTPGAGKLSCIASMTVEHTLTGTLITNTRVDSTLLHPTTIFTNPAISPDSGEFHTSCSRCLQCGDLDSTGKFFIKEIVGLPGDKLADKCMVLDASCSL